MLIQDEKRGALATHPQSVCAISVDEKVGQTYIGEEIGNTLAARDYKQPQAVVYSIGSYNSEGMKSNNPLSGIYKADTIRTLDNSGCNPTCNQGGMAVIDAYCVGNGQVHQDMSSKVGALNCMHDQQAVMTYGLDRASFNQGINAQYDFAVDEEKSGTLVAKGPGGGFHAVVRRLTPLECERLQGFPDGWTDIGEWIDTAGKRHKDADSPRYKALGNSIALPFWEWLARRIAEHYQTTPHTMASLFDGIGGFPIAFSRAGFDPVWASEIEEFPIAVTKRRIPG